MFSKIMLRGLLAAAVFAATLFAGALSAHGDVFNMPSGQTSLQFVTVGDPGNVADPATGNLYGSVGHTYQIGKYDVTAGQYCQFLNAVATTSDPNGLYNSLHGLEPADNRDYPKRKSGQLQLHGHGRLQPSRQLPNLRRFLG